MRRLVTLGVVVFGLLTLTACSSGKKDDNNAAEPTPAEADQSSDTAEEVPAEPTQAEVFVEICEKRSGEPSQHATSDAIRQWFAEDFGAFVGCQDVYEFYNTPNFSAPLFLVDKAVTDISLIEFFENLGTFVSAQNQIEDWSPLGSRTGLQVVSIVGSNLTKVPDELVGKALTRLILGSAPITDFSNLAQITTLELISLNNMELTAIPEEVTSSGQLQVLIMDGNPLADVSALASIPSLTVLSLFNTGISTVPAEVANLANLSVLEVSNNPMGGDGAFAALDQNASIVELYAEGTELTAVPIEIGSMAALEILFIGENALITDYTGLGANASILGVRMNGNALAEVPVAVPLLLQLEALGANRNEITSVAPLAPMASLQVLGLAENPIATQANKNTANCPSGDAVASPAINTFCAGVTAAPAQ
ncbi:MAG: leucine-rich repeat domain-containing protein [Oligoflexus sp.]